MKKVKKIKKDSERFVYWRRKPSELTSYNGEKVIDTLANKIKQANEIIEAGAYDTVLILEIKKVVTRAKAPVKVQDFK